ncbi:hypothetical protein EJB05_18887, partial [Eragrostis curvula]
MGCCSSKDVATKRSGAPLPRIVDDDTSYSHSSTVHGGRQSASESTTGLGMQQEQERKETAGEDAEEVWPPSDRNLLLSFSPMVT